MTPQGYDTSPFDNEFLGPLTNALTGDLKQDPTDVLDPANSSWDIWDDKRWLISGESDDESLPTNEPKDQGRNWGRDGRVTDDEGRVLQDPMDEVIGAFSLSTWEASYDNGYIPDSALAAVAGTQFKMEPHAAQAMGAMIAAAGADGVELTIGNSYRDFATQQYADTHDTTPGTPTAAAGTSNHGEGLAVDFVITPENHAWLVKNAGRFGYTNPFGMSYGATENWHWEFGQDGSGPQASAAKRTKPRRPPADPDVSLVPLGLAGGGGDSFSSALSNIFMENARRRPAPDGRPRKKFKGKYAHINEQLYQGFMDANHPGLARMVGTPAMNAWIGAESGFDPHITSPANNNGLANDGLFQIWRGHDFNSNGEVSRMSPYEQAQIVAQYFDLTVEDIKRYYEQIQSNTYAGWG